MSAGAIAAMEFLGLISREAARSLNALDALLNAPAARRARRLSGFHPEQPNRSAMHTAYRAKTRRRGRR